MHYIRIFFLILFYFKVFGLETGACAQTPIWNWANGYAPSTGSSFSAKGLGTDSAGNIYQAAITGFPLTVGPIQIPAAKAFIVKYNNQGNLVWVSILNGDLYVENSHVEPSGNILLTGKFRGSAVVGTDTLNCQGAFDMFVAKFDNAGNGLWARRAGGIGRAPGFPPPITDEDGGTTIGADPVGNVYVAGYYYHRPSTNITFDSIMFPYPAGSMANSFGFLAKYNANGKVQWVKTVEGLTPLTAAKALAVSRNGNCYMTGFFTSQAQGQTFGPGSPPLVSQGGSDIWVTRFAPNGNLDWARRYGGANSDVADAIAVNRAGEFFLTGYFKNSTTFGPLQLTGNSQNNTIFLAKFDALGNIMLANQTFGTGSIGDAVMVIDSADNAYVGASYSGSIVFGQQTLPNSVQGRPVVLKWNSAGQPVSAAYGSGSGTFNGIALSPQARNCYLSGNFSSNLTFDSHTLPGGTGFFLASLGGIVNGVQQNVENTLRLYPNPARDLLYFDLPEAAGNVTVKITDLQGRDVLSRELTAGPNNRLRLPSLAKGVYLVTVQTRKQVLRQKLVIE